MTQDTTQKLTQAELIDVKLVSNDERVSRFQSLVNKADHNMVFAMVGRGYKPAQHDDVVNKVESKIADLKLTSTGTPQEIDGAGDTKGARLHLVKRFPDIGLAIDGEFYNLTITVDNSYDLTTGLRVEVGAYHQEKNYHCFVSDRFANLYHKHTGGMMLDTISHSIEKGITVFQTKVKAEFETMVTTAIDPAKASIKLDELSADEDSIIPKKYIEEVKKVVDSSKPTTQWRAYKIVMEVMSGMDMSVERRRQVTNALVKVVRHFA